MPFSLGFWATAGAGAGAAGAYELISTTLLTTTNSTITFASIPQTYKHLQLRITARHGSSLGGAYQANLYFNGDNQAQNSAWHYMQGNGSAVSSTGGAPSFEISTYSFPDSTSGANIFGAAIIDILDYTNTSKNKTVRSLTGFTATQNRIVLGSGHWRSLSSVSSVSVQGQSFIAGSRFSLYGIKG